MVLRWDGTGIGFDRGTFIHSLKDRLIKNSLLIFLSLSIMLSARGQGTGFTYLFCP